VNWNILVTSGKEIKRDSMSSVSESRSAQKVERNQNCLNVGEPSSKAKYNT